MALAVELQVDAVVDDPFAMETLADSGAVEQLDGALLQHAGADPRLDSTRGLWLSTTTDSIPARSSSSASVSPAGPAPMIATCVRIYGRRRHHVAGDRALWPVTAAPGPPARAAARAGSRPA